jgi:hypothetical protein
LDLNVECDDIVGIAPHGAGCGCSKFYTWFYHEYFIKLPHKFVWSILLFSRGLDPPYLITKCGNDPIQNINDPLYHLPVQL